VAARQDLGLKARFRTDGRIEHLIEQLEQGIPCPVGRLHTGLVIGWDRVQCQFLMQDPNGEGDLVNGGYVNTALGSGQAQPYFERNWGRRLMMEGAAGAGGFRSTTGADQDSGNSGSSCSQSPKTFIPITAAIGAFAAKHLMA